LILKTLAIISPRGVWRRAINKAFPCSQFENSILTPLLLRALCNLLTFVISPPRKKVHVHLQKSAPIRGHDPYSVFGANFR
jgi:hypothetical protein